MIKNKSYKFFVACIIITNVASFKVMAGVQETPSEALIRSLADAKSYCKSGIVHGLMMVAADVLARDAIARYSVTRFLFNIPTKKSIVLSTATFFLATYLYRRHRPVDLNDSNDKYYRYTIDASAKIVGPLLKPGLLLAATAATLLFG